MLIEFQFVVHFLNLFLALLQLKFQVYLWAAFSLYLFFELYSRLIGFLEIVLKVIRVFILFVNFNLILLLNFFHWRIASRLSRLPFDLWVLHVFYITYIFKSLSSAYCFDSIHFLLLYFLFFYLSIAWTNALTIDSHHFVILFNSVSLLKILIKLV